MRLEAARLRSRRLQLGLTTRGLARETRVSQTLITRLEDTGDPDNVTCEILQRILDALSLDLVDILERDGLSPPSETSQLEHLGAILFTQTKAIAPLALARRLELDEQRVEPLLAALAEQLRPTGIRVRRGSAGIRLVAVVSTHRSGSIRNRCLESPTATDLRLLHRAVRARLHTRQVAATNNGNVSLSRLIGAGLIERIETGALVAGPIARSSLLLDDLP